MVADVPVPDITIDAQTSTISNTGSLCSGSADIAMCPPVRHAAASPDLETFVRDMSRRQTEELAVLTNSIASAQASVQEQMSELIEVTTRTTNWIRDQQARSIEIDETLAT